MTKRKIFTSTFKLEIAKLIVDENYTIKQACEASGAGETLAPATRGRTGRQTLAKRPSVDPGATGNATHKTTH